MKVSNKDLLYVMILMTFSLYVIFPPFQLLYIPEQNEVKKLVIFDLFIPNNLGIVGIPSVRGFGPFIQIFSSTKSVNVDYAPGFTGPAARAQPLYN